MEFKRILVPVELSGRNTHAIDAALHFTHPGGLITLLHVVETIDAPYEELETFYRNLGDKAREVMETLSAPLREADILLEAHVRYGHRVREIVRFAHDKSHDLILLESHRLTPKNAARLWTSISHQVAVLAQCPVLLVK